MLSISYINMGWQFQSLLHYVGKIGVPLIVVNRTHMTVLYWQRQRYWIIALPGLGGGGGSVAITRIVSEASHHQPVHIPILLFWKKYYTMIIIFLDYIWDSFSALAVNFSHFTPYSQQHLHLWLYPSIIFPLRCIMGSKAAQWFLRLAKFEREHWHIHVLWDGAIYSTLITSFQDFIFYFFRYLIWSPPLSDTGQGPPTAYTLLFPAGASFSFDNQLQSQTAICPCTCS